MWKWTRSDNVSCTNKAKRACKSKWKELKTVIQLQIDCISPHNIFPLLHCIQWSWTQPCQAEFCCLDLSNAKIVVVMYIFNYILKNWIPLCCKLVPSQSCYVMYYMQKCILGNGRLIANILQALGSDLSSTLKLSLVSLANIWNYTMLCLFTLNVILYQVKDTNVWLCPTRPSLSN